MNNVIPNIHENLKIQDYSHALTFHPQSTLNGSLVYVSSPLFGSTVMNSIPQVSVDLCDCVRREERSLCLCLGMHNDKGTHQLSSQWAYISAIGPSSLITGESYIESDFHVRFLKNHCWKYYICPLTVHWSLLACSLDCHLTCQLDKRSVPLSTSERFIFKDQVFKVQKG